MSYDSMNRAYFLEKAGELISGQASFRLWRRTVKSPENS